MKKNQKNKKEEKMPTLKDALDENLLQKLKETKKELGENAIKQKEEEEERKREERRKREKNKTFEELLSESNLDWRKYK